MEWFKKHRLATAVLFCFLALIAWNLIFPPPKRTPEQRQQQVQRAAAQRPPESDEESRALLAECEKSRGQSDACKRLVAGPATQYLLWLPMVAAIVIATWFFFIFRKAAPKTPDDLEYASVGARILSVIAESIFVATPFIALHKLSFSIPERIAVTVASSLVLWTYSIGAHALWGQNVGKMIARIKVVRTDGTSIGWQRALLRQGPEVALGIPQLILRLITMWQLRDVLEGVELHRETIIHGHMGDAGPWLDALTMAWVLSEAIIILFNAQRRALHDFIAGTIVVKKRGAKNAAQSAAA